MATPWRVTSQPTLAWASREPSRNLTACAMGNVPSVGSQQVPAMPGAQALPGWASSPGHLALPWPWLLLPAYGGCPGKTRESPVKLQFQLHAHTQSVPHQTKARFPHRQSGGHCSRSPESRWWLCKCSPWCSGGYQPFDQIFIKLLPCLVLEVPAWNEGRSRGWGFVGSSGLRTVCPGLRF